MTPKTKATATETKMATMTDKALSVLSRSPKVSDGSPAILMQASMKVPPRSSKTSETVVEVGMPSELKMSRMMTSVTITARKMVITCSKEKLAGVMMPCLAMSIMPDAMPAPKRTPKDATRSTVRNVDTLAPTADCRKLTASLLTPTKRSKTARHSKKITIIKYRDSIVLNV